MGGWSKSCQRAPGPNSRVSASRELWFCMQTGNFVLVLVGHELEESSRDGFTQARVVSDAFSLDLDDSSHEIDVAAGEVHVLVLDELRGAEVGETLELSVPRRRFVRAPTPVRSDSAPLLILSILIVLAGSSSSEPSHSGSEAARRPRENAFRFVSAATPLSSIAFSTLHFCSGRSPCW